MKNNDSMVIPPELQQEINTMKENFEKDEFACAIEEHGLNDLQLCEDGQLTPALQSLVDDIESHHKVAHDKLMNMVEHYNEALITAHQELNKLQQSNKIYKNEINKLMRLLYARNCLIEKLAQDIQTLKKQQQNSNAAISSKILF